VQTMTSKFIAPGSRWIAYNSKEPRNRVIPFAYGETEKEAETNFINLYGFKPEMVASEFNAMTIINAAQARIDAGKTLP